MYKCMFAHTKLMDYQLIQRTGQGIRVQVQVFMEK